MWGVGLRIVGITDGGYIRVTHLETSPINLVYRLQFLVECIYCLEGQVDLVSILTTPISHRVTPLIPIIILLTQVGREGSGTVFRLTSGMQQDYISLL